MVCPDWAFSQQPRQLSIKQFMTAQEFKAAGLEKLSSAEFQALEKWFNRHTLHIYRVAQEQGSPPSGGRGYLVEHAVNDETFIINGNVYKAKLYCMTLNRGDRVIFAEGSPHGACVSAKLVNLRNGDICELWCE
jgi:hypothetical protein